MGFDAGGGPRSLHAGRLATIPTGALRYLMHVKWILRRCTMMVSVRLRGALMKHEPEPDDLRSGDPLADPGLRKVVGDIAKATHSGEDAVRALFVDAYETLNRDARIFGFVPLLAAKRVRKILDERGHRAHR